MVSPKRIGIVFALFITSAIAQYRGVLQGTVTDASGGVVANAQVTLTSQETGISRSVTSNGSGTYAIPGLAPGRYSVTVEAPGFAKKTLPNVMLTSEQAQGQNVQLEVAAQVGQTVNVNASAAPAIDTETGNVAATLSGQQIEALPTFGRDPFQTIQLAPGVFGDNSRTANGTGAQALPGNAGPGGTSGSTSIFQTENQVQASADGTRTSANSFQIDGVEVNSLAWGGAAVITPNKESIKEITVQANPYNAENGRNSGAQVLVVSQNGTNDFHGSALIKMDRPGLNAYQRFNGPNPVQKNTDRFNQYAGSIGGPIVRNHLFFFFSYETLRNDTTSLGNGWYETPQFLSAVQSAVPNSIAARIAGFPGEGVSFSSIVPQNCAFAGISNPAACQVITNGSGQYLGLDVGSPLRAGLGTQDPTYVNNGNFGVGGGLDGIPDIMYVQTSNPTSTNPQQFNGRLDYQATSRDLFAFTSYFVPVTTQSYNGPVRPANLWTNDRTNEAGALLWDHTFSPAWLNEARFDVTRWLWNEISSNPQEPWGLPQGTVDNFGSVNLQYFGAPGPSVFNQTTYNIRDTLSTVRGNHSIKVGVDILKEQDNDSATWSARPSYNFRNMWDFANDAPYQEVGNFDPRTGRPSSATKYIRSAIYAGFIQDDFKVRPNLTLNLGIRWEYFTPIHEKYGNISNVILGTGPDPLTGLKLRTGGDLYNSSYNNWAPQFGFAWTPNPASTRAVIRGGFGIGYNRMQQAVTLNGRNNPPLVVGLTLNQANLLYQIPSDVHQFSGWPVNPNALQSFDPATGLPANGAPVALTGLPTDLATPVTYRYSLGTEYNLGGNWVARIGYQGSLSRHQTIQNNLNLLYPTRNPQVNLLWYFTNDSNANFNALLTEIQHQFSRQFEIDAQYRWSKTIDQGSNDYFVDQYPFNRAAARGPADFDVAHLVKTYGRWTPRFFQNDSWAARTIGGWELTGIMNWHTGFPWTPVYSNYGCNLVYSASGYCSLRPGSYLGGAGTDYSNSAFINGTNFGNGALASFSIPTIGANGIPDPGVGRNILRGPEYFDVDMSIQKSFTFGPVKYLGEGARLTLRADVFNVFNKLNLSPLNNISTADTISFDGTTSNPQFGKAQSALAGRIVELQARFSF